MLAGRATGTSATKHACANRVRCSRVAAFRAHYAGSQPSLKVRAQRVEASAPVASADAQPSRRDVLLALGAAVLAVRPAPAQAANEIKLPQEYRQLVKRLSEDLGKSIEAEGSGASEAEVRRQADPAKDAVREFVRKWRDNPRVNTDATHAEIKEALNELGEFYLTYGQRTPLTAPVREGVLGHLRAAREALRE
ncbi:hypothetical protein HYH03_015362 [Edaphochlamys debaryana]|uniref:Uncharacterized protein n=1 Tax=Edaphochlamys debaryana TaxID=47281 RepID=A0A835XNA6_9CHLO|nr:hypothetical protein HYH03_015362 [Edaphochlamys debaryana]|eukprot:KAG2485918.1 hypothetical protein HYH03_015362 [Edaphochlamys debaryana]